MHSLVLIFLALPQQPAVITLDNVPPVVVSTRPVAGADGVPFTTNQVQVTFSKSMRDKSWSWVQVSKETFPSLAGQPRYLKNGKTCTVPVRLESGKIYAIWLNTPKFNHFRDRQGRSAVPYLLVFRTTDK